MSKFPHNLSILRRRAGYTQESLAEALGVSRQAVGKWESGQAMPEAATLVALADLLDCSLDRLIREELDQKDPAAMAEAPSMEPSAEPSAETKEGPAMESDPDFAAWRRHMDRFSAMMALGVALVLEGVALTVAAAGLWQGGVVALPLLFCVAGAAFLFVLGGISHEDFQKEHPRRPPVGTLREREAFRRRFRGGMALAVSGLLVDVTALVALTALFRSDRTMVCFSVGLFFFILAACVGVMAYLGIQSELYLDKKRP